MNITGAEEWNNFKNPQSGMDLYGKQRLELAIILRDRVLNKLGIPWIVENGTLLGAFRNGKFIIHDDDFDIALFFESEPLPELPKILKKIKQLLPDKYKARIVSSYSTKIEIFDPSYGSCILAGQKYMGARYHHVNVDFQCYQRFNDVYKRLYKTNGVFDLRVKDIYPIGKIMIENEKFQAPNDVESVLKSIYGDISPGAKYNKETAKYELLNYIVNIL